MQGVGGLCRLRWVLTGQNVQRRVDELSKLQTNISFAFRKSSLIHPAVIFRAEAHVVGAGDTANNGLDRASLLIRASIPFCHSPDSYRISFVYDPRADDRRGIYDYRFPGPPGG